MRRSPDIADEVALAEAAAWLARLQGGERSPATEAAFRAWVEDADHARAFARVTETWDVIPGAAMSRARRKTSAAGAPSSRWSRRWALAPAAFAACGLAAVLILRQPVYTTAVGQQQTITLSDGTRVALNTDSRLSVAFSRGERRVRLDRGEALFEVAKNAQRPFIVQVGQDQVRATGTKFDVRNDQGKMAVVLLEGHVVVSRKVASQPKLQPIAALEPGERLTDRTDAEVVTVDRPKVETATAWRRGEVMFDDSSLADAVAELNRYGGVRVEIGDPDIAGLRVSGVFETQDPAGFAQAVAELHHLRVERTQDAVVLSR